MFVMPLRNIMFTRIESQVHRGIDGIQVLLELAVLATLE